MFEFIRKEFDIKLSINEDFQKCFQLQRASCIYSAIFSELICVISKYPEKIHRNNQLMLHSDKTNAVEWGHSTDITKFDCYYWNGINVPEKWIINKESLTKEDIVNEQNAEKRRCLMEILGAKKYYNTFSDGNGIKIIDEDNDEQGNLMILYETIFNDNIISKKVQFLEVICPSTKRVYNIYPPNQQSKNVWDAKASTFNNFKIQYRQGDVGLFNINKKYNKPIIET